ncbi:MAG: GTPase HflX [Acidimicrobiales bacterium]
MGAEPLTTPVESHRGGFGEYGGEERGLIDRTFRERIVLVGVIRDGGDEETTNEALDELAQLVQTAGADEVARVTQRRHSPDPATFVGQGKAQEIYTIAEATDADTVVFDDELTPAQQANLERVLKRTALDRTAVILDIFAQNASTPEGRAQVELAQLRYRLPRLRGSGNRLSQQAGGIGTRGPGETQLEVDRRRLVRRVHKLEHQLSEVAKHRQNQSKKRRRSANQGVAIVGYTNAGKSTLLNRLTDAGVLVEDRLFATLDAITRRLQLPGGEAIYLTDTVGFVRKLPHHLVEAFKTTLDVVTQADLLVHVVDSSAADPVAQMDAVRAVVAEIGGQHVPELLVFNKADLVDPSRFLIDNPGSVAVSATTGQGVEKMLLTIGDRLRSMTSVVELLIPFDRGDLMAQVHREAQVLTEAPGEGGMIIRARLDDFAASRFSQYTTAGEAP